LFFFAEWHVTMPVFCCYIKNYSFVFVYKRCPQKHISRLQRVQHALARVVMQQAYHSSSSTELLKQLHWLPIEWRIRFKPAISTCKALHTGHPPYLTDLLQYHNVHALFYQSVTCNSTA